jgi:hypothetical protein
MRRKVKNIITGDQTNPVEGQIKPEPRWAVLVAALVVGGIYFALPESLAVGPRYLQLAIIAALGLPATWAHWRGWMRVNIVLGHAVAVVTTIFLTWSVVLLVAALPSHREPPLLLLRSGAVLWVTNVLVFAHWYWRLDGGGPHARLLQCAHTTGSFLFPQMCLDPQSDLGKRYRDWAPQFIDYLFVAFNHSTAFSPTDTAILSRWAKVLTMLQSLVSLTIIGVLVARSINIL